MIVLSLRLAPCSLSSEIVSLLFSATTREDEPPVKRGGALFAPTTGFDSKARRGSLDDSSETHIFIKDESRKAYSNSQIV
jgi:hypothetical protein